MARVAVIGEPRRIHGYGLPDAILCPATDQAEAVLAWRDLPDDIDVAVLTPSAARWLASEIAGRPGVLPVLLAEAALTQPLLGPDPQPERGVRADPGALAGPGEGPGGLSGPGGLTEPGVLAEPGALGESGLLAEPGLLATEPDSLAQPRVPPEPHDLP
jgi:hypothetical protein